MEKTAMNALIELLKVNDIYKECMPYIIEIIEEVYLPMEKKQIEKAFGSGAIYDISESEYYKKTYEK